MEKRYAALLALSTTLAATQGFAAPVVSDPLHSPDLRPALEAARAAAPSYRILEHHELELGSHCRTESVILQGDDPVTGGPQKLELLRYIPVGREALSTELLIHPPTKAPAGGSTPLDRWYGEALCKAGIRTSIMETWDGYQESGIYDFGSHDRAALRALVATRVALAYIQSPVYIFGTSVGAIYSSMLLGMEKQVLGGVLIVGGAPLVEVLKTTDQTIPRTLRELRMANFPIADLDAYEKLLSENVRISPENYIAPEKKANLFMVIATQDTTVPTPAQFKLWNFWGQPDHREIADSHVKTVVRSFLKYRKNIRHFLQSKIEAASAAQPAPGVSGDSSILRKLEGRYNGVGDVSVSDQTSGVVRKVMNLYAGTLSGKFTSERNWHQTSEGMTLSGQYKATMGKIEVGQPFSLILKLRSPVDLTYYEITDQKTGAHAGEAHCASNQCEYRFDVEGGKTQIHEIFEVDPSGASLKITAGAQVNVNALSDVWTRYTIEVRR